MIIDVAGLGGRNDIKEEAEKILKCEDLIIQTQRMWNLNAKVIQ